MKLEILLPLLDSIHGCTFATINSETWSSKLVRCVRKGERAIIFRTKGGSGYGDMVKRRLVEAGLNPDGFIVAPLAWGERVDDLPLIKHKDNHYLQFIRLAEGKARYFLGLHGEELSESEIGDFGVRKPYNAKQGLPKERVIEFREYRIDNITKLTMLGDTLEDTSVSAKPSRAILRLNYRKTY